MAQKRWWLVSVVVVTGLLVGCASHQLFEKSPQTVSRSPGVFAPDVPSSTSNKSPSRQALMNEAQQHYKNGIHQYEEDRLDLASNEFDLALRRLLDAKLDIETQLDLAEVYSRLFEQKGAFPPTDTTKKVLAPGLENEQRIAAEPDGSSDTANLGGKKVSLASDLPVDFSRPEVQRELHDIQEKYHSRFQEGLDRMVKYLPRIKEILRKEGLPTDLAYLPLVESNFYIRAKSTAGAAGLWQFMPQTAKEYGLNLDEKFPYWVDERYDWEKSTRAAVQYLEELQRIFVGSWELALAAYNLGENGLVYKVMLKYRESNFWVLAGKEDDCLPDETKRFVPRILAAILVAKTPAKYGFESPPSVDENIEKLYLPAKTDLKVVARACNVDFEKLIDLNPTLLRRVTPPWTSNYPLYVPSGTAQRYELAKLETATEAEPAKENRNEAKTAITAKASKDLTPEGKAVHVVRPGDSLWKIAERYNVSIDNLAEWNNLRKSQVLNVGQKIILKPPTFESVGTPLPEGGGSPSVTYTVNKGDNVWEVARKHNIDVSELLLWNGLTPESVIYPGDKLIVSPQP